jgi:O-acetylhomoserine/O-acetylserine sulfhydrylase
MIDGGHLSWASQKNGVSWFTEFVEPADGYSGMGFYETYGHKALAAELRMDAICDLGPCMSPFNAWLFLQGLARWLEAHPSVNWVLFAGVESHLDHEHGKKVLTRGFGGVLAFGVAGTIEQVSRVVASLQLCSHLANVGDAKTLIIRPWRTFHQQLQDEEKIQAGVTPDLIRISLGLGHISDIIHDFEQAFSKAFLPN